MVEPIDPTSPAPEGENKSIIKPSSPTMSFVQTFELLTKGWVLLLAAIYASGYIAVSIYHASLGLNEINPLRPKVAAAGILLLALVMGAVYVKRYAFSHFNYPQFYESESQRRLLSNYCGILSLYLFDLGASFAVSWIMRYGSDEFNGTLFLALMLTGFALLIVAIPARTSKPRLLRLATHWSFLSLYVITALALVALSIPRHGEFGSRQMALFLASIQLATKIVDNLYSKTINISLSNIGLSNWNLVVGVMLMPLILFGVWVYPHTDAAFGGGEPSGADMSILASSGSSTPTSVPVKIVDETDSGFYVIETNDSRVRYIPRNLVTSVSFDKPKGWY